MTRFLVDTNVISELAPGKNAARPGLLDWLAARQERLFLSVVTTIEIDAGILKMVRRSPGRRQQAMTAWLRELEADFADRILPLTHEVGRHAAAMIDRQVAQGLVPEWPDIVIAATAEFHRMTLLTRNIRHFAGAATLVVNPFSNLPE